MQTQQIEHLNESDKLFCEVLDYLETLQDIDHQNEKEENETLETLNFD